MIDTLAMQYKKNDFYQDVLKSRVWQAHGSKLEYKIEELRFVLSSGTVRTTVSCHWGHWQINRADGGDGSESRILFSLKCLDIKCVDIKYEIGVACLHFKREFDIRNINSSNIQLYCISRLSHMLPTSSTSFWEVWHVWLI